MDNRGYNAKSFGFTKEVISNNSRRIHPIDDENNAIPIHSIDNHSPSYTQSESNDTLLQTNKHFTKQKKVPLNDTKSISSTSAMKGLLIVGGIILGICSLTILPTVIGVLLVRNPTVTNPTTTSTVAPTVVTAYWSFDNNANDMYGIYNGAIVNSASYSSPTYFGYGYYLALIASSNQSIMVSSPFFNLSYTSFTVEAWIYGTTLSGDNAIFSQCQCTSCQDQCLYLIIRNNKMYMSFTLDDLIGVTTLLVNTWYHVAYLYDYSTGTQLIYLQGVLENSKTSAGPYQGSNGSIFIGIGPSNLQSSSFNGYIDNLKLTTRAKSAAEILADATMVVYFSFDGSSLSQDVGPNGMNGTLSNAAVATGKVGQGLALTGALSSYLQIYGFYQLSQANKPFSFSIWVYPYSISGGLLIQRTRNPTNNTGYCTTFMGIDYLGQVSMVINNNNGEAIIGPVLSVRTWTHLGYTYSQTNGMQMYTNGILFGTTGTITWGGSATTDYLSIGSYVNGTCGLSSSIIYYVPYTGVIDEFYVFRRELNASEVLALANP